MLNNEKIRYMLVYVPVVCILAGLGLRMVPVEIYLMPINAWERKVWMGPTSTQKEENYVVYHHCFKSERTLINRIIAFNDRTIRLDSVKKYPDGYCRSFFKKDRFLTEHYREEEDGSDIIYDHFDKRILLFEWRLRNDTVYVEFFGKHGRVPLTCADNYAIRISTLSEAAGE